MPKLLSNEIIRSTVERPNNLLEPILFKGQLARGHSSCALEFYASIDSAGDVNIVLNVLPFDDDTKFIVADVNSGQDFARFILIGTANDETIFETNDLFFTCASPNWSEKEGVRLRTRAFCRTATFTRRTPDTTPSLQMRIRGFRGFHTLSCETSLGLVSMTAVSEESVSSMVSGMISLQARADIQPNAISQWLSDGEALLENIVLVMSFACANAIRTPILESYCGNKLDVKCRAQSASVGTGMPVFHFLDQGEIFSCAVRSFFNRRAEVEKVRFAIAWFVMEASHTELRLVNAMTALENLIDSNLSREFKFIQSTAKFKKISREVRRTIRAVASSSDAEDSEATDEICSKISELNRRSLLNKLRLLAGLWNVPIGDLDEEKLHRAKKARDLIVHQGTYALAPATETAELWHHMTLVRELVARLLLAALGYEGRYISYVGGYHDALFKRTAATALTGHAGVSQISTNSVQ